MVTSRRGERETVPPRSGHGVRLRRPRSVMRGHDSRCLIRSGSCSDPPVGALTRPRSRRRKTGWTRTCARSSDGISARQRAARSGSSGQGVSTSIRCKDVLTYDDLDKFGPFQDEWLRGGPVRRWVPKGLRRQADLRVRDRRQHGRAQVAHRTSRTFASTTRISARRCPTMPFRKARTG